MAIKKEEVKNPDATYEVNIYVETAYDIFQKCLLKAGLKDERHMPARLSEAIAEEFNGSSLRARYLSNLNNKIKNSRQGNKYFPK